MESLTRQTDPEMMGMAHWLRSMFGGPRPSGPSRTIRSFRAGLDTTLTRDHVLAQGAGWVVDAAGDQTVRLFEVADPMVERCLLAYRARLRTEGLAGRAYLEMWCRIPGRGEFFSKGLHQTVRGTTGWGSYEVPFHLKEGQRPDLLKLNLVVEGRGRVRISDVELLTTPLA
jgi:hypothetical protein